MGTSYSVRASLPGCARWAEAAAQPTLRPCRSSTVAQNHYDHPGWCGGWRGVHTLPRAGVRGKPGFSSSLRTGCAHTLPRAGGWGNPVSPHPCSRARPSRGRGMGEPGSPMFTSGPIGCVGTPTWCNKVVPERAQPSHTLPRGETGVSRCDRQAPRQYQIASVPVRYRRLSVRPLYYGLPRSCAPRWNEQAFSWAGAALPHPPTGWGSGETWFPQTPA